MSELEDAAAPATTNEKIARLRGWVEEGARWVPGSAVSGREAEACAEANWRRFGCVPEYETDPRLWVPLIDEFPTTAVVTLQRGFTCRLDLPGHPASWRFEAEPDRPVALDLGAVICCAWLAMEHS